MVCGPQLNVPTALSIRGSALLHRFAIDRSANSTGNPTSIARRRPGIGTTVRPGQLRRSGLLSFVLSKGGLHRFYIKYMYCRSPCLCLSPALTLMHTQRGVETSETDSKLEGASINRKPKRSLEPGCGGFMRRAAGHHRLSLCLVEFVPRLLRFFVAGCCGFFGTTAGNPSTSTSATPTATSSLRPLASFY